MADMRWGLPLMVLLAAWLAAPATAAANRDTVEVVVTLDAPPLVQALRSSRALTVAARRAPVKVESPTSAGYLRELWRVNWRRHSATSRPRWSARFPALG